ncbi:MAG: DUF452 family protein [Calditerrivibrio sp.]|nr:DUF452 family protein [Calditerrivibrio sp.]MCA1932056.1 DUF452 family protein [Calditerrivibrio sp.]
MNIELKDFGSKNLIIFFNGFSLNSSIFKRLEDGKQDILYINDYREIPLDLDLFLYIKNYRSINLIAYSFGVFIAASIKNICNIRFDRSIAINGTLRPVDNHFGIPENIFKGTLEGFDDKNLVKFYNRVFDENYNKVEEMLDFDTNKALKELKYINDYFKIGCLVENIFDKAIISSSDRIFPPQNQVSFWQNELEKVIVDGGHFPFFKFNSWGEILSV